MARRSSGEGSVHQLPNGKWRAVVTMSLDSAGKPRRKYAVRSTKAEAAAAAKQFREQRDAGQTDTAGGTVAAWLVHWLDNIAATSVRPNTLSGYANVVHNWAAPRIGRKKLDKLTAEDLEGLYSDMIREGVHPDLAHRTIRRALNVAVTRGKLGRNPALHAVVPKDPRGHAVRPALDDEQVRSLLATARKHPGMEARVALAVLLGMRQGEVLGSGWDLIDWTAQTIRIDRQAQRVKGKGMRLVDVKSKASNRVVPLPEDVMRLLKAWRRESRGNAPAWVTTLPTGATAAVELLFPARVGTPQERRDDWEMWHDLLKEAKLPAIPLHAARVTAATRMVEAGVHPRTVQEILGQASMTMAMQVYTRVQQRVMREALSGVSASTYGATG